MDNFDRFLLTVVYDIPNLVFVVDTANKKIIYANQHALVVLGQDCVGKTFSEKFGTAGGAYHFVSYGHGSAATAMGEVPLQSEYFDDETENWFQVLQREITWIDGTRKFVFVLNEINALKRLQKNLSEAHATLAFKNRELELEKNQALANSEANATLSTLIASVSHELRTPIGNGVMTASALADQAKKLSTAVQVGSLKRSELGVFLGFLTEGSELLLRNLNRAEELLTNFRQVAADQASEQRREFDLAEVVRETVSTLAPSLRHQPHQLVMEIPAGIRMDSQPGPIGQVVINLINNAWLHAFENRSDGVLTIRASSVSDQVHLSFIDNGVGISEENLTKLFKPFFSTKIGKGGTGLGMAIVENLVKKTLGGDMQVHSTVGQGTRFDIQLPLVLPTEKA